MTRHDPRKPSRKPTASNRDPKEKRPVAKRLKTQAGDTPAAGPERQRIAKLMARVGLCSRRDAEAWIVDGRVSLNGEILTSPAQDVGPNDTILVDGEPLPEAEKTRLFLFHKPRGLVVSDHDPEGRETVADYLREHWPEGPRVMTVGRLDINTEGLLLLTNDGGLARVLELPATGWVRRYRVRAKGETDQSILDGLRDGLTIEGVDYAGIEAKLDRIQGANCWLTMGLREGKNREIKRVLEHIGLEVNRLIRLSFGPFQLLDLPEGKVDEIKTRILRDQLGETLAAEAGVDFQDAEVEPQAFVSETKILTARDVALARKRDEHRSARPGDEKRERKPFGSKAPAARQRGRDETSEPPEPKRERPVSGTRKHVSALRADEATSRREGPRKRIERAATTDRNDRAITVERLVRSRPEAEAPRASRRGAGRFTAQDDSAPRRPDRGRHASPSAQAKQVRIARSGGDQGREEGRPDQRPDRREATGSALRKTRSVRPEAQREDRPSRDRPPRERPSRERPARSDRPDTNERPKRAPRDETSSRRRREDRPSPHGERGGPRPKASHGEAPRGERPKRNAPGGEKPWGDKARSEKPWGDKARSEKPRGDKPKGKGEGKPSAGRARPDRTPPAGKDTRPRSTGRPGSGASSRGPGKGSGPGKGRGPGKETGRGPGRGPGRPPAKPTR